MNQFSSSILSSFKKIGIVFFVLLFFNNSPLIAQDNFELVEIDVDDIRSWVQNAPMERTPQAASKFIIISLPLTNGQSIDVRVIESPMVDQELAARYPEVKTFAFQGIMNPAYAGRLMVSPRGIDFFMFTPNGDYLLAPNTLGSTTHKLAEVEPGNFPHLPNDAVRMNEDGTFEHQHTPDDAPHKHDGGTHDPVTEAMMMSYMIGPQLRNFRMHVIADAQYSVAVCGASPTRACVEMAIMTALNGMNALYIRDMAVKLNLTSTTTIYRNASAHPSIFAAAGGASNPPWNSESAVHHVQMETMTTPDGAGGTNPMVPRNSYDVGHLFSSRVGMGLGGGGVANLNSVCSDNISNFTVTGGSMPGILKAGGGSSIPNPQGPIWVELLAHEFTHQFNADHTWSGNSGNCTPGQWSGPPAGRTSYEPGGGSTIVSYSTICADDNIPNLGNTMYYHTASIKEVNDYIASAAVTCESTTASGNQAPVPSISSAGCTPNLNIPIRTPFEITGSATDDGGTANLTYTWEQFDLAPSQHDPIVAPTMVNTINSPNTLFPLFRSYFPTSSPQRIFPAPGIIASGMYNGDAQNAATLTQANWQGELLPEVAGRITMRLTVRDNNTTSGGVEHTDALINVVNTAGPYAVTAPNTATTIMAGASTTVTWNVANTNQAPISCNTVNIKLSTDGGQSFPITLATAVANDGSESVAIPSGTPASSMARIKVECGTDCFKFFDISNVNFNIMSNCMAASSAVCPTTAMMVQQGAAANLSLNNIFGANAVTSFPTVVTASNSLGQAVGASTTGGTTCMNFGGSMWRYSTVDFTVSATGTYALNLGSASPVVSIFTASGYNPATPCTGATFLGSNFNASSGSTSSLMSVMLTACTTYKMVIWASTGAYTGTATFTSPPGTIYLPGSPPSSDYSYTYVAVNTANNQVAAQSATSDFSSLGAGTYCIYGASYKSGGSTPPAVVNPATWVGMTIAQISGGGACAVFSNNCKPLTISPMAGTCNLTNLVVTGAVTCSGNNATIPVSFTVASGSGSYNIVNSTTNMTIGTLTGATTGTVTGNVTLTGPTTAGTIMIKVVDGTTSTCMSTAVSATIPTCPIAVCGITNLMITGTVTCMGNNATIPVSFTVANASGSYNIVNSTTNMTIGTLTGATTGTVTGNVTLTGPTTAGTIMIKVVDGTTSTCMSTAVSATIPTCPVATCGITNLMITGAVTCMGNNATIPVSFTTANASGSYNIVNSATNMTIGTLTGATTGTVTGNVTLTGPTTSGTIMIKVVDGTTSTCMSTAVSATIPTCPIIICDVMITNVANTPPNCPSGMDGTITISATSSSPPITYAISGPSSATNMTGMFSGLAAGTYNVTVTDATSGTVCSATSMTTLAAGTDTAPPVVTCPANVMIECGQPTTPTATGMATATDNCGMATVSSNDVVTSSCGNTQTIARTWTATDASNNMAVCTQTITVVDNTPPIITCPANVMVECGQPTTPTATGMATATDNCGMATVSSNDVVTLGCGNTQTIARTWTATDDCGQMAVCTQTITVVDNTPPVITCPANVTVECGQPTTPTATGMATATDNCGMATVSSNDVVTSGCGNTQTIARTWTATDDCGQMAVCTQTITVVDNTPPVITCPANVTVECDQPTTPAATGMATAIDNCGAATVSSSDVITMGVCPQEMTIARTWTATDDCGLTAVCTQTITVDDSTPPVAPPNLASLSVQCLSDLPQGSMMTAPDNCAGTITAMSADAFAQGSCSSRWTVTRTWSFDDGCGNVSTTNQTIHVIDDQAISITAPADQVINCSYNVIPNPAVAEVKTPCGSSANVTTSMTINGTPNCPGATYNVTYTATDDCGRTASDTQVFTIQNDPPKFVCPPEFCIIDCPADNEMIASAFEAYAELATIITSCSGDISIYNDFNPNGFINQNCNSGPVAHPGTKAYQIVTFFATDQCGRTSTCTAMVIIQDHLAPIISGETFDAIRYYNDLTQLEYDAWIQANLENLSAQDECNSFSSDDVEWTWSPAVPNTEFIGPFATTLVTFTASDGCGNEASVTATFRLKKEPVPHNGHVSGSVHNEAFVEVGNVDVSISHDNMGQLANFMTSDNGQFAFDVEADQNYEVLPYRNDDPLNGVNTMDLIRISKHILGIEELDSPYKMIAADVNNSGGITAADLVEIRKLILFINDSFSNNTSWRFVDEAFVFPNPTNPFASTFPSVYSINGLTLEEIVNFIAIKVGDVNGTAITNQLSGGDTRNIDGELFFYFDDLTMEPRQVHTIDFKAKDFKEILGYQFSFHFNTDLLKFVELIPSDVADMSIDNFGFNLLEKGVITSSWNQQKGMDINDETVLFSITFMAKNKTQLSEVIHLGSQFTHSEAYNAAGGLLDLKLNSKSNLNMANQFSLHQNRPNPFDHETLIGFHLIDSDEATLTIYDLSGRILQQYTGSFTKGYNEVKVNRSTLDATGLVYYRLSTSMGSSTKKMIILN